MKKFIYTGLPEELRCFCCSEPLTKSSGTTPCGHTLCKLCIDKVAVGRGGRGLCKCDRRFAKGELTSAAVLIPLIKREQGKCQGFECDWTGSKEKFREHKRECRFQCPKGCNWVGKLDEVKKHEQESCPKMQVKCPHFKVHFKNGEHTCKFIGTRSQLELHLQMSCPAVKYTERQEERKMKKKVGLLLGEGQVRIRAVGGDVLVSATLFKKWPSSAINQLLEPFQNEKESDEPSTPTNSKEVTIYRPANLLQRIVDYFQNKRWPGNLTIEELIETREEAFTYYGVPMELSPQRILTRTEFVSLLKHNTTDFRECSFVDFDFSKLVLLGLNFSYSYFKNVTFFRSTLEDVKFDDSLFDNVEFIECTETRVSKRNVVERNCRKQKAEEAEFQVGDVIAVSSSGFCYHATIVKKHPIAINSKETITANASINPKCDFVFESKTPSLKRTKSPSHTSREAQEPPQKRKHSSSNSNDNPSPLKTTPTKLTSPKTFQSPSPTSSRRSSVTPARPKSAPSPASSPSPSSSSSNNRKILAPESESDSDSEQIRIINLDTTP